MRWPFLPLALIYGAIVSIRNLLFDIGILPSKKYSIPIIGIGNLSTGGTGKSPMTIYIMNLVKDEFRPAVVSRGYGRKSKGLVIANYDTNYNDVGDEAMQIFERFRNKAFVAVSESRRKAIDLLINKFQINLVVLDDCFQHRYVNPGLKILLTAYDDLYTNNFMLPVGDLREPKFNAKRADIIVVTKCPDDLIDAQRKKILESLKPKEHQSVYFSHIHYENKIKNRFTELYVEELNDYQVLLVTGIANATPLLNFLQGKVKYLKHISFKDHHAFTEKDVENIDTKFQAIMGKKLILTTEKDYMRLKLYNHLAEDLFFIPIETTIENANEFNEKIMNYARKN